MKFKILIVAIPWTICIIWAAYFFTFSPKHSLTAEHHELINRFRERRYSSLQDISPKPHRIVDASEMFHPLANSRFYIHYLIFSEDVRVLVIVVDERLGLIEYFVRRED